MMGRLQPELFSQISLLIFHHGCLCGGTFMAIFDYHIPKSFEPPTEDCLRIGQCDIGECRFANARILRVMGDLDAGEQVSVNLIFPSVLRFFSSLPPRWILDAVVIIESI
ncbi:hypothetical protein CH63R_05503 [Colletotrichum higginsianum IMI 349063]|uniref:Uncharacterized protein n=1 Tax=Colletotrichum higginsianum (strain IMI 349063) TaxID=759273 RepID=A0A1B7YCG0_COLHI|nr:hypothetical protein CH63R_05503 [Colletotrichum higginsianum IMI 349063]OBR09811.1 hypothetical protein CH63R_05503 [Colletotrichum higginsianum IMI 349063]